MYNILNIIVAVGLFLTIHWEFYFIQAKYPTIQTEISTVAYNLL